MPVYIEDPGDIHDKVKWDLDVSYLPVYKINGYPYKASSLHNARRLERLRAHIDQVANKIATDRHNWERSTKNQSYINGVNVFLGLHQPLMYDPHQLPSPFFEIATSGQPTTRYLLSEIPSENRGFDGMNIPRMRFDDLGGQPVGKDGTGRALYRDILLNLNHTDKELDKLLIHELAHSMANHIFFYEDNHHADFKWAENLIKRYW